MGGDDTDGEVDATAGFGVGGGTGVTDDGPWGVGFGAWAGGDSGAVRS